MIRFGLSVQTGQPLMQVAPMPLPHRGQECCGSVTGRKTWATNKFSHAHKEISLLQKPNRTMLD
jgi:hypothetical protein